jgi:hypothetical protein
MSASAQLFAGAELKLEYALFHFVKMGKAIEPDFANAAYRGWVVDPAWSRTFSPHLDAFLSSARSVPETIQCCFGHDPHGELKPWFDGLSSDEQLRRKGFRTEFRAHHAAFAALPLSHARNVSLHRAGYPQYTVQIVGAWGTTYLGSAVSPIPPSEIRQVDDPALQPLIKPRSLEPRWSDFSIDGRLLFAECQDYLQEAQKLLQTARTIVQRVHGTASVTPPPD